MTIKSINPEKFINKLKILSSSFNKDEENDIGELITFLIEQINSEAKEINEYKNNNVSCIYDIFFGGKNEIITECLTCINNNQEKKFVEEKDLYYLMFKLNVIYDFLINNKIKETNKINIYDCLNYYESPKIIEQNGKECDKCGNKEAFLITSKIKKCQNNLLVLLNKNFINEEKNENIKFELNEIIDMKNFIKENENKEKILYGLYAIICLSISFEENKNKIHHVAFCKSPVDGKWYKYDDNIVETVTELENEVDKFGMPVALFYQKNEEIKNEFIHDLSLFKKLFNF
jgi:ubiquitin C-terminal hydrolase